AASGAPPAAGGAVPRPGARPPGRRGPEPRARRVPTRPAARSGGRRLRAGRGARSIRLALGPRRGGGVGRRAGGRGPLVPAPRLRQPVLQPDGLRRQPPWVAALVRGGHLRERDQGPPPPRKNAGSVS